MTDSRAALEARLRELKEIVLIVREYDDLDEHTPCEEGHREFIKKYGEADIYPVLLRRVAELESLLAEQPEEKP